MTGPIPTNTLGIFLHHPLLLKEGRHYAKEVWWDYVDGTLSPLFADVILAAPVDEVGVAPIFQTREIPSNSAEVVCVRTRSQGHRLFRGAREWLSVVIATWRVVSRIDMAWILMPCLRGVLAGWLCRLRGVPYVVYCGSQVDSAAARPVAWILRSLGRQAARHATFVLAAGRQLTKELSKAQPATQETAPVLGISPRDIYERPDTCTGQNVNCLYVGSLADAKRPGDLIEAVALLRSRGRQGIRLGLVGPGDSSALEAMAEALGVGDTVDFRGYVPNGPELYRYYREADIFLFASEREGFPRVLYEAMAHGLPVVTTPVGGIPLLLGNEENALFAELASPRSLADATERLLDDPDLRTRLIRNGYRVARDVVGRDGKRQIIDMLQRYTSPRTTRLAFVTNVPAAYRLPLYERLNRNDNLNTRLFFTESPARTGREVFRSTELGFEHTFIGDRLKAARLLSRLRQFSPTAIVSGGAGWPSLTCALFAKYRSLPFLVFWAGTPHSERRIGWPRRLARRWLFSRADGFLAYSEESRDYLLSLGLPLERITVLGNVTIDPAQFNSRVRQAKSENGAATVTPDRPRRIVLSVGQFIRRKNFPSLIEAFGKISAANEDVDLVMVGAGPEEGALRALAREVGRTRIVQEMAWHRLAEVYAAADIYVHPSSLDQWPQAVNEAMAAGVPVIVSRQSGVRGLIEHGREGYLFESNDSENLAALMADLLEDPEKRRRMGRAAFETISHFGAERVERLVEESVARVYGASRPTCD